MNRKIKLDDKSPWVINPDKQATGSLIVLNMIGLVNMFYVLDYFSGILILTYTFFWILLNITIIYYKRRGKKNNISRHLSLVIGGFGSYILLNLTSYFYLFLVKNVDFPIYIALVVINIVIALILCIYLTDERVESLSEKSLNPFITSGAFSGLLFISLKALNLTDQNEPIIYTSLSVIISFISLFHSIIHLRIFINYIKYSKEDYNDN